MCDPVTIGTAILSAAASSAANSVLSSKPPKPSDPIKPPAEAKKPDYQAVKADTAAATVAGPSSTFLTGPAGVDLEKLKLGRSTLLGG